jgi:glycosyltransferase involved in cell wall biosynthesis
MGYWGQLCPSSPIFWLPNQISPGFTLRDIERDIDVLVQVRKSSSYLLQQLVPALQERCHVVLLDRFVDDLAELFNRSKVYLYDTAEYWAQYKVTEGFGLPPMEAMACGCQVFSSVNGALADYLDPGFNCQSIGTYSTAYDVERILGAIANPHPMPLPSDFFDPYREEKVVPRLRQILESMNQFFDHTKYHSSDIPELTTSRITQLRAKRLLAKIKTQLGLS